MEDYEIYYSDILDRQIFDDQKLEDCDAEQVDEEFDEKDDLVIYTNHKGLS